MWEKCRGERVVGKGLWGKCRRRGEGSHGVTTVAAPKCAKLHSTNGCEACREMDRFATQAGREVGRVGQSACFVCAYGKSGAVKLKIPDPRLLVYQPFKRTRPQYCAHLTFAARPRVHSIVVASGARHQTETHPTPARFLRCWHSFAILCVTEQPFSPAACAPSANSASALHAAFRPEAAPPPAHPSARDSALWRSTNW